MVSVATLLLFLAPTSQAQSTPDRLSDDAFWKLSAELSESGGAFQSENLLSNETDFPHVMADLQRMTKSGGVYLGVGPEQNFNYIAAIRPGMAFIVDIRRGNLVEHLLYKAIFEISPNRSEFIARLFSRKRIRELNDSMTAAELFDAYIDAPADMTAYRRNLKEIEVLLTRTHGFVLSKDDLAGLDYVYSAFRDFGPLIDYSSRGGGPGGRFSRPSYARLMTETDRTGREWSYLASEQSYWVVRDLEQRNLIVPLTGDLAGPTAIRAVGKYLKEHDAIVSAFYVSNVEGYLFQGGDRIGNPNGGAAAFYENVAALPLDGSSTFIRWLPFDRSSETSIALAPIQATIADFREGRLTATDFSGWFRRGPLGSVSNSPRGGGGAPRFSSFEAETLARRVLGIVVSVVTVAALLLFGFFAWYLLRDRTRR
jgi:hypothetical protein